MKQTRFAILGLAVALGGCNVHGRPAIERKARPVAPQAAATEAVELDTVVSPGVVEPWGAQVELSAQEPGWISAILVKEGAVVETGHVLAALDATVQQQAVEVARADLAEAEASLARMVRGATQEELEQARAEYRSAAAREAFARATADRFSGLHADGLVSDDERDRLMADARAQSAIAEGLAARLAELERGARAEDREAARARARAARAKLELAEASLARRRVVAVQGGTVLLSRFHAGEFYTPGAGALFVLGDMTRLQVRLEVDEIDAAVPVPGATCAIYSDAGVRLTDGTIVRLAPKMGRRVLPLESPTARADVRVREVFVEVPATSALVPNQRVWGHTSRAPGRVASGTERRHGVAAGAARQS